MEITSDDFGDVFILFLNDISSETDPFNNFLRFSMIERAKYFLR